MNIGYLVGRFHPVGTGGSVSGFQLARGLTGRGHRLLTWHRGSADNPLTRHHRFIQLPLFLARVDVLYVRVGWRMSRTFQRLRRMRLGRLPVVWVLHGGPEEILFGRATEVDVRAICDRLRRLARSVDAGIGVTEGLCSCLAEQFGIERTFCIPNGSDPELFQPGQGPLDPEAPLRVVWIGSARMRWHDTETLLAAADILAGRGCNIAFDLYARREDLPAELPANVTCPGLVPYDRLGEAIGCADVGVHLFRPANGRLIDGSPLKLFDYMACGLAVLAQEAGQTGRVIAETGCGLHVAADPEELAARLAELEGDRALCRRLGGRGRQAVVDYYNWARAAAETEAVLEQVLAGSGRQSLA